jgi:hypothetical protein
MPNRLRLTVVASLLAAAVLALAPAAYADSPHYVKGPTVSVNNNSLTVSWKAAGLGNTIESVDFELKGTIDVTAQCFTKTGNPVQGVPKTETNNVDAKGTFPVRNGQVTGSLTVSPLSTLRCTGNQVVKITDLDYDLTLTGDGLDPVHLTP